MELNIGVKAKCSTKYTKKSCLKKYGSEYYLSSDEFNRIRRFIKRKSGEENRSKFEIESRKLLNETFEHVEEQFMSDVYPFHCDFYIKSIDLYIEINGMWVHGGHPFDKNNPEDIKLLNKWKEKANTSTYYRRAIKIWTESDVNKREVAKKNNLNFIEFWNLKELKDWVNKIKKL